MMMQKWHRKHSPLWAGNAPGIQNRLSKLHAKKKNNKAKLKQDNNKVNFFGILSMRYMHVLHIITVVKNMFLCNLF